MTRQQRKSPTKRECRLKLREAHINLASLAPMVQRKYRLRPRELFDALDGIIGQLAEVQMTLTTRSGIKPHNKRKGNHRELRPDLWWPRYWMLVRELKQKGINPKSEQATAYLMPLAENIFD